MKKVLVGIGLGILAGLIDVSPMFIGKLPWAAIFAAFTMWVIVGFFISITSIRLKGALKGIVIAILILLPSAFIIGDKEINSLIPIGFMTIILGGLLGFFYDKITGKSLTINQEPQ